MALFLILAGHSAAAPYPKDGQPVKWVQPNGKRLTLRVFGDEFYARTVTPAGYTVVFKSADKTYYYAKLGKDGKSLVPSRVPADRSPPQAVRKHLKEPKETVSNVRKANIRKYVPDRAADWENRVTAVQRQRALNVRAAADANPAPGGPLGAPISGTKVGLVILVQFPNDPATGASDPVNFPATRAKMVRYCNEAGYGDDGNSGSIRDYFYDQSNGQLVHTQLVTTIVTLPHPRNYYNYSDYPANSTVSEDLGGVGRTLIADAIAMLRNDGFDFSSLSVDASNRVLATSLLFAGENSGVWAKGLWPHASSVSPINVGTTATPRYVSGYQITNVPDSAPVIGTVCHELGHLLLGYPDLYDYGFDSTGAGSHCLMAYGNHLNGGRTPAPIDLYLKDVSGWANITDLTAAQSLDVAIPSTGNRGYRIRMPGSATEYFLVENRGSGDKWASFCPDAGIAIWHVDEGVYGNSSQQRTPAQHYQVSLEQADGLFNLENNNNLGDGTDLFDSATGFFNNGTNPDANWWSGAASGISISVLSTAGPSMNVRFGSIIPTNTLIIEPPTRSVAAVGITTSFEVTSNITWSWSDNAAWVTSSEANSQSGDQTFSYTVAPNPLAISRTAVVSLTAGSLTRTHTITQAGVVVDDHGANLATATLVAENSATNGNFEIAGDEDYFRINVPAGGLITLQTTGTTDTYGYLLDSSGTELVSDDDAGTDTNFLINYSVNAGTYYVRVRHYSITQTGIYQLLSAFSAGQLLSLNPLTQSMTAAGGFFNFVVTTNTDWNWSDNATWVASSEPVNQSGIQTFGYVVAANPGASSRTAVITLTSGALVTTHTITQAGAAQGQFANMLMQTLPDGTQSTWYPYGGNALDEANLLTPRAIYGDAFDTVGRLEVETPSYLGTVTATNIWGNHAVTPTSGNFATSFVTTPGGNNVDTTIGFSSAAADSWDDLAAYVRFNDQGKIDARNGSGFSALANLAYSAGVSYLVEMEVNVATKRYRVTVTPAGELPVLIADNFSFRTEQNAVTQLSNFAYLTWTGGTQTVGSLAIPALGTVTATQVWGNHAVDPRTGIFAASFRTTPGANAVDTAVGFSSGTADFWDDLAAYVRFNTQGKIDARNGGGFAAASVLGYTAGVSYLVEMEIDVPAKRYRATVTPAGGLPVIIADNYAFRTEQNSVTQLANFAYLTWSGGTQTMSGLVVSDFGTTTATNVWENHAVAPQTGTFVATFATTPSGNAVDTVLGFSNGAADFWDDLAAYVRFNPSGMIDARNDAGFSSVTSLHYTAGVSYLVQMEINVITRRYRATVMPAGGVPVLIADNYVFRTEQNSVTQLSNFACLTWTGGTQTVRGLVIPGNKINLPALSSPDAAGPLATIAEAAETRVSKEINLVPGLHASDEIVTLTNLASGTRQVNLQITDNYGSDGNTTVHLTSSGDNIVGPGDFWFVSNDRTSAETISYDPTVMISWRISSNLPSTVITQVPGGGNDQLRFNIATTLAGGETATVTIRRQLFESAAQALATGQPLGGANLASLTLSAGSLSPAFSPYLTAYSSVVSNSIASLIVTPAVAQAGSTLKVNGTTVSSGVGSPAIALAVGNTVISVEVTSQDGATTTIYTIEVSRPPNDLENWRNTYFGTTANAGNAANSFDFDHDGLSNLLEYAFGLNPKLGSSCATPKGQLNAGNFVISFGVHPGAIDMIDYSAEWSATMAPADWHAISDTGAGSGYHTFSIPVSTAPKLFVRLKANTRQ